ncbi:hypothetical protein CN221_11190 [Sinorhizobium meliloti]|nr:hypothetical protein CN221_11190 [Sinorhizobium meliloti]RVH69430.1 hypothetical protein CN209_02910 [Sinorhizobium meliloti]
MLGTLVGERDFPLRRAAVVDEQGDCLAVFIDGYDAGLREKHRRSVRRAAEPSLNHCMLHQLPRW